MAQSRRQKGTGTVFKKTNGNYVYKYRDVAGQLKTITLKDENGQAVTVKSKAETIAAEYAKERCRLESLGSKAEYIAKVAEIKKIIQHTALKNCDIWQAYLQNPNRPESGTETLAIYQHCLKKFQTFAGEAEITEQLAGRYMVSLWNTGISSRTYNKHLQALKLIFRIIHPEDNPFAELKAKPLEQESRKPFTITEINSIFNTLNAEQYYLLHKDQMRILLLLGLCFGLRLHDAACFKWEYIQGDHISFKPYKTRRKMRTAVVLPIPPILQEQFSKAQAWKRNEYLLPDVAERYQCNDSGISQDISKLLERSGLQTRETASDIRRQNYTDTEGKQKQRRIGRYSFHSFRHTFCTFAANSGKDLSLVKAIVGHSAVAMTEHYTHFNLEAKRSVIETIPLPLVEASDQKAEKLARVLWQSSSEVRKKVLLCLERTLSTEQKRELIRLIN